MVVEPPPPPPPPVVVEPPPPPPPLQDNGMGLNPGWIGLAASTPYYQTSSPNQAQYYWGAHPYMSNLANLEYYNGVPPSAGTPTTTPTTGGGKFSVGPPAPTAQPGRYGIPGAPAQPWGASTSAVGGTQYLDVNTFLNGLLGLKLPAQPQPTYSPATLFRYTGTDRPWTGINPYQGAVPVVTAPTTPITTPGTNPVNPTPIVNPLEGIQF